jgi:hypothetical protein
MATPYIRARAKDNVDTLDNLTAYLDSNDREEVVEYVRNTLHDIAKVMAHASENGMDPVAAFEAFVVKFEDYWNVPTE